MSVAVGVIPGHVVSGSVTRGLDRDRALCPVVMTVSASYYAFPAVTGGSTQVLITETAVAAVLLGVALAGFEFTLWIVVAALGAQGIFDFAHPHVYANRDVPVW